jgi:hypothetical protein
MLLVAAALAATGCAGNALGTPDLDGPYIAGTVVDRTETVLRVDAGEGTAFRTRSAIVRRGPQTRVRGATWESIRVGHAVTVWNTGPELRSLPPQVTADSIIVR